MSHYDLTPGEFLAWVANQPNDCEIGKPWLCYTCPIAKCLNDLYPMKYQWAVGPTSYGSFWHQKLPLHPVLSAFLQWFDTSFVEPPTKEEMLDELRDTVELEGTFIGHSLLVELLYQEVK